MLWRPFHRIDIGQNLSPHASMTNDWMLFIDCLGRARLLNRERRDAAHYRFKDAHGRLLPFENF